MQRNPKHNLKIVYRNKNKKPINLRNNQVENIIISAAKLSKTSEVKVFFKNILASEYTLGYEKFCGLKIRDLVFYNPSLFDLYPKIFDFIYINGNREESLSSFLSLDEKYISLDKNIFNIYHNILNSNIYINLDVSFDEMIRVLDIIITSLYGEKVLKVLIICSIKS